MNTQAKWETTLKLLDLLDLIDEECGDGYHYCQGCKEITDRVRAVVNEEEGPENRQSVSCPTERPYPPSKGLVL